MPALAVVIEALARRSPGPRSPAGDMPLFVCPACGTSSPHPADIAQNYCSRCHWFTGDAVLAAHRP